MNESLYKIGFHFSPEEHVKLAMRLQHPASEFTLVPAQGNLCAWGALGGGLTAALGALAFSCPVPLCEAVGGCPSPHLWVGVGRTSSRGRLLLPGTSLPSSPSGGHRLRSFAGWLLLAHLLRQAAPLHSGQAVAGLLCSAVIGCC